MEGPGFRGVGWGFSNPALNRQASDHDARPFHGFHEDCASMALGKGTQDGLLAFFDVGVNGVKGEIDKEVHS